MDTLLAKLQGAMRSWVIWFNTASAAFIANWDAVKDAVPQLQTYIPERDYKWVAIAVVAINLMLRFRTSTSLQNK